MYSLRHRLPRRPRAPPHLGERRGRGGREAPGHEHGGNHTAQGAHDLAPQALPILLAAVVQECGAAGEMVEDQERAGRDVVGVRRRGRVEAAPRQALEVAHAVIGGVTDETSRKRNARNLRFRLRRECERGAQCVEKFLPRAGPRSAPVADGESRRIEAHLQALAEADERVPRQALPTLHAFQEKAGAKRPELQVGGHGRVQIGGDVEGRLHVIRAAQPNSRQAQKNPSPSHGGDGFWISN